MRYTREVSVWQQNGGKPCNQNMNTKWVDCNTNIDCPPAAFKRVTTGSSCQPIYTLEACEEAARQLGFQDTSAEDDRQNGVSYDPPYCYYESGRLKFNHYGSNRGSCNSNDVCLCINGNHPGKNDNFALVIIHQQ